MGDVELTNICSSDVLSRANMCRQLYDCDYCKHKSIDREPYLSLCEERNCYGKINLFRPLLPPTPINIVIIIIIIISGWMYIFSRLSKLGGILFFSIFTFFILGYFKLGPLNDFWIKSFENCPSTINNILCSNPEGKDYLYLNNRSMLIAEGEQCIYTVSRYDDRCPDDHPIESPGCTSSNGDGCYEHPDAWTGCSTRFLPWQGWGADCKKCCKL